MASEQTCEYCRFSNERKVCGINILECRRYPPKPKTLGIGYPFPETLKHLWCGEWRRDEAKALEGAHDRARDEAAAHAALEGGEAKPDKLRDSVTAVIIACEHDIAQGVEPSEDRRRVIAVLRAALEGGVNEKAPDR